MAHVEIVDPFDTLTPEERTRFDRAFVRRIDGDGRESFDPRPNVSGRALKAAAAILQRLRSANRLSSLPTPPRARDWFIWKLRQNDPAWTYEALAAERSVRAWFSESATTGSIAKQAKDAVKRVDEFCRRSPAWWIEVVKRLMVTD